MVDNVKVVLQINEDRWDSELFQYITSASALVDGLLSREGFSAFAVVPQILVDATKYFRCLGFQAQT